MKSVNTAVLRGIEGVKVNVEVDIDNGIPAFIIIGLGDTMVKEAGERIKGAIINSGLRFPKGRIVVNLSPANIRKKGSHLELAVAVGILAASGQVKWNQKSSKIGFFGELSLGGEVLTAKGILPMSQTLIDSGIETIVMPQGNQQEEHLIDGQSVKVSNLNQVVDFLNKGTKFYNPTWDNDDGMLNGNRPMDCSINEENPDTRELDFADVRGQEEAKRAIVIAAAGNHGLIMVGSPGSGKTMLAKRIPTILPPMTNRELIQTATIYSVVGKLDHNIAKQGVRPFRAPYYKSTAVSLIGGGQTPMPGEISLAHNGVLFLDEIGEFSRNVLDTLRTPMEEKKIAISRKGENYTFPSDFLFVAASNPCKCGYYGDPNRECTCTQYDIDNYRRKISGPLSHRIDLHIYIPNIDFDTYDNKNTISTDMMRDAVLKARKIQHERYQGENVEYNSQLNGEQLYRFCQMSPEAKKVLKEAYENLNLTPRTCEKTIKIARTIADIDGEKDISVKSMAEALSYRGIEQIYGRGMN